MDREQAKLILSAACSGEEFPEGNPLLEEALALMESDPALADWFAAQNELDEPMRQALRSIEPPPHLRESILASIKVTPFPAERSRLFPILWMSAAGFVALAAIISIWIVQSEDRLSVAQLNAEIPRLTEKHGHSFGSKTGDLEAIRSWLAANGGATNFAVPEGLKNRGGVGCEVMSIRGTKVSVLCFHIGEGRTAHLYIVDRAQISNSPPMDSPTFGKDGDYAVASWSHGNQSYFLAKQGDIESLRGLL